MNEPEPPDFERTLPARPSQRPESEGAEPADLERTMPAREPRSSDEHDMADLEKTFVPPGSFPPPVPPTPPAIPQPGAASASAGDAFIPPASRSQTPIWVILGCVGCGLVVLVLAIAGAIAYFAWRGSDDREKLLRPPVPVPERSAPSPGERPALLTKPGHLAGLARFADGRPVPAFRVSAIASDSPTSAFVRDIAGRPIAEVEGRDGRYELRVGDSAKTIALRAIAQIAYRGRTYHLEMHPTDADAAPFVAIASTAEGAQNVTHDFVLKISGVRPGYDGRVVKETTSQDKPANAFYGGTIHLDFTYSEGAAYGAELARTPPEARIAITLTPEGPLLDGSAGRHMVREIRPAAGQPNFYFHLHNIPLGVYTATARRIEANGDATPLRLSNTPRSYQPAATIDFVPGRAAKSSGIENVTLFVVK